MKIINCFLGKSRGGIEVVALDYADALAECGYESEILTLKKRNYTDYLIKGGHKMHYLIGRGLNPITILHFVKIVKSAKPDVVFLHGTKAVEFGTNRFVQMCCPNVKFIGVSHGVINKKYKKLKYALGIANFLKQELKNIGIQNTYSCQNTTKITNIPIPDYRTQRNDTFVMGSMGRASNAKGFDIILHAISLLKKQGISIKCKIAGPEKTDYEELITELSIQDEIECLGWITDKDAFYHSIDLYVSGARFEQFGLTLIEAMVRQCPVIATECKGPKEILTQDCGILVPINDATALSNAILKLAQDDNLRQTYALNGRNRILSHFNNKDLPNRLKKIIEDVCAN